MLFEYFYGILTQSVRSHMQLFLFFSIGIKDEISREPIYELYTNIYIYRRKRILSFYATGYMATQGSHNVSLVCFFLRVKRKILTPAALADTHVITRD